MPPYRFSYFFAGLLTIFPILLFPLNPLAAEQKEIAKVISLTPEAWTQRSSGRVELTIKAPLYLRDSVRTSATGKAQLLFADNTTISVASNSEARMEDFIFEEHNARFGMRLISGASRIVTGKVVKANPDGFTVTTPQAIVGIRGTDCTILADGHSTKVIANHIGTKDILITNLATGDVSTLQHSGMAVDVTLGGNILRPATEQERAAATQAMRNLSAPLEGALSAANSPQHPPVAPPALEQTSTPENSFQNPLNPSPTPIPPNPVREIYGTFSGALSPGATFYNEGGRFQFNVALHSGSISDAVMMLYDTSYSPYKGFYGGTGSIGADRRFVVDSGWREDIGPSGDIPKLSGAFGSDGRLTDITWEILSGNPSTSASGTGNDFSQVTPPQLPMQDPKNIQGTYAGTLDAFAKPGMGTFGFDVVLGSGRVSNANMTVNYGNAQNLLMATGGGGAISAQRDFMVTWNPANVTINDPQVTGAKPELSGSFNQLNNTLQGGMVNWSVKDAGGNVLSYTQSGSPPTVVPLTGTGFAH